MMKTFLLILTTFPALWLSGHLGFNLPLTFDTKPDTEISIAKLPDFKSEYKVKTIVIDAGHGGRDGGCSGTSSSEKKINLIIAKKVKVGIEAMFPDMRVIMTRDKDVFIPLHKRAKIANESEADLFLSIHCNALSNSHVHGSESYVLGLHNAKRNLEVAKRENDVIFLEEDYDKNYGFDPNSPAGHIMVSAFQNANLEQSILFAQKIETRIKLGTSHKSRGVKQAGFHVLRETSMPSVLLETGYLTSGKDQDFLVSEIGQQTIANAVVKALSDYKKQVETGFTGVPEKRIAENIQPSPRNPEPEAFFIKSPQKPKKQEVSREPLQPKKITPQPIIEKEVEVKKTISEPVQSQISEPVISPKKAIRIVHETPVSQTPKVEYRVQIAASKTPISFKDKILQIPEYALTSVKESGINKYQIGNFDSFKSSLSHLRLLKNSGFKDAFIVSYDRNKKISLNQARKLTSE